MSDETIEIGPAMGLKKYRNTNVRRRAFDDQLLRGRLARLERVRLVDVTNVGRSKRAFLCIVLSGHNETQRDADEQEVLKCFDDNGHPLMLIEG